MKRLSCLFPILIAVLAPLVLMGAYPGAFTAFLNVAQSFSALQTFVSGVGIASSTLVQDAPNASSTGTTLNKLAKLTATGAVVLGTGDSASPAIIGICVANCSTTGNASVAIAGSPSCIFDGATTAGDYVVPSITTGGDCHDTGSTTVPTGIVVIGTIGSTHGSGGTYPISINPVGITAANNAKTTPGGSSGQIQYNNSNAFGGFTASGDATIVTSTGVVTVSKVNGVTHPASPSVNTVPVVTSASSGGTVTYEAVPNNALANSATTVNGTTCTLGSTCTPAGLDPLATGSSTGNTLTGPSGYFVCTAACTVTPPVPVAGYQFCVMNDDNVSGVITLGAIGSSARYENTGRTAYGTAGTGTLASGGAVGDMVCIVGRDSTHYLTTTFKGTWTAS